MKLGDISDVRSGLVLYRKESNTISEYKYTLLNLRSFNEEGYIEKDKLDIFFSIEKLNPEYLTQKGDVVVRLSRPYTSVLIDSITENMVISSNFVVIRVNKKYILPEYLVWLLNTKRIKHKIYENTTSNMIGAIKPNFFRDFEFELPPINKQKIIGEINILSKKEYQLMLNLAEEKKKHYEYILEKIIKK